MTMTTDARPIPGIGPKLVPILFTATIFLSASLLFFVQPLFTKIVLPHIGGAPAVWTTAMLFFQTILIAGYAYAHFSTRYLPVKGQMALHLIAELRDALGNYGLVDLVVLVHKLYCLTQSYQLPVVKRCLTAAALWYAQLCVQI